MSDPRRHQPIKIQWNSDKLIGRVEIDGQLWCAVEWSDKRQAWCIEDAEGKCLTHSAHIHGQAAAKDDAVALAFDMVRDGRMPSPEQAAENFKARRERRRQQPAQQRRRAQRDARDKASSDASSAKWHAEQREKRELPLYEAIAEIFDFVDRELWRSNSFAALRPRLIVHLEHAVASLESERAWQERDLLSSDKWRKHNAARRLEEIAPCLKRAREILELLLVTP
jgi:hypothetical protein